MSQLSPLFKHNQDLVSTIIANRLEYSFIFLLVLCKIYPTEEDIFHAFKGFGNDNFVFLVFWSFFSQHGLLTMNLKGFLRYQKSGGFDFLVVWPGSEAAKYYFYILVYQTVREKPWGKKFMLLLSIFMVYIFAAQNRSTLIIAIPCYLYALMKAQTKSKWILLTIIVVVGCTYLITIFDALIKETQSQLGDRNYNRWQAVEYYLFERNYGFYDTPFGNGRPSAGSDYFYELSRIAKSRFAILSDIGLLGTIFYLRACHDAFYIPICFGGNSKTQYAIVFAVICFMGTASSNYPLFWH